MACFFIFRVGNLSLNGISDVIFFLVVFFWCWCMVTIFPTDGDRAVAFHFLSSSFIPFSLFPPPLLPEMAPLDMSCLKCVLHNDSSTTAVSSTFGQVFFFKSSTISRASPVPLHCPSQNHVHHYRHHPSSLSPPLVVSMPFLRSSAPSSSFHRRHVQSNMTVNKRWKRSRDGG